MTLIPINDDIARLIGEATGPVILVDTNGRHVGNVTRFKILPPDASEEEVVAEIRRRMADDDGIRYTHTEVMSHLRSLTGEG
jgi:hypothetical protein